MTALTQDVVADLRRRVAELEQRLQSSLDERDEAIAQQAATAEVLQVINASPGDLAPVFDAIVEKAARLCDAAGGALWLVDGDMARATGGRGGKMTEAFYEYVEHEVVPVKYLLGRAQDRPFVHVIDLKTTKPYQDRVPFFVANVELGGVRTSLSVPLNEAGRLVGIFTLIRWEVRPFTDKQIALVQGFAAQAQIAMKNARLLSDLRTTRDRQAASAEILRAIASTPGDAERPLQQIAETTARLFGASSVTLGIASGDEWGRMIRVGPSSQRVGSEVPAAELRIGGRNLPGTVFRENRQIHIPDLDHLDPAIADWPALPHARAAGARAMAGTPLRREGKAVGALVVHRDRPVPFTDEELALLQSFADQAVIAIENARLFNETKEALEQQKASADILRAISSSVADTQPAFDKILDSCRHLFGSDETAVLLVDDRGLVTLGAYVGKQHDAVAATFPAPVEKSPAGHAIRERRVVHYTDAANDAQLTRAVRHVAQVAGYEAMAYAPMMWNERGIGAIGVSRLKGAFSDKELALLQTFADQAVIAIQNARLFNETREALERQTATADILKVIASSPSDVQPVFEAIATSANRLIGGFSTAVFRFVDGVSHLAAFTPTNPAADEVLKSSFPLPLTHSAPLQMVQNGETVQIADTETAPDFQVHIARARGFRSIMFSPLMSNGAAIGMISVTRVEPGSFADHHVQLLQTFADQAVIAIENTRLFNETGEALERQTATADILKVIASSPSDVQPVFEAIAERSNRLVEGLSTGVYRLVDDTLHLMAFTRISPQADAVLEASYPRPLSSLPWGEQIRRGELVHVRDAEVELAEVPALREMARQRGWRSSLLAPLLRDRAPIGVISVTHKEPGTFAAHHVQLLQTFADQAVIAIENTRLFNETREALERQTATADILKVIASSPSDVQPVFEAIATSAKRLIGGFSAAVFRFVDDVGHLAAFTPTRPAADEVWKASFPRRLSDFPPFAWVRGGEAAQIPDVEASPDVRDLGRLRGFRSVLVTPLMSSGVVIGMVSVTRLEPGSFAAHHVQLLQTFADQAVIAIENVRLFDEVQARTEDLRESLQQQTATADVLKVISRSAFDLQTVLDTLTESAARLCNADMAAIARKDAGGFYHATNYNFSVDWVKFTDPIRLQPERGSVIGRALLAGAAVQIPDVLADPEYAYSDMQKAAGYRALLGVPLLRGKEPIGVLFLGRKTVEPFTEKQIELVSTFADQAVIAIENVRLFDEVQAKTRELEEALTYQTGSSNILGVIASSPTDVGPVLKAIVESACELCEAYDAVVLLKDGDDLRFNAHHGPIPIGLEKWPINRRWVTGRSVIDRAPVHVHDLLSEVAEFPEGQEMSRRQGHRTILSVPMLREGESIGAIVLRRTEVQPFRDKQIALLQTFADQAVIAIGNVRLFEEVQAKTRDLSEALQQQTATADVLKVISRSAFDLDTVMNTLARSAAELCGAGLGALHLREGDLLVARGIADVDGERADFLRQNPIPISDQTYSGRAVLTGSIANIADAESDRKSPLLRKFQSTLGYKSMLIVPLMREGRGVGMFSLARDRVGEFSQRQIELVQTFADQAVIAIENVRLFDEVQAKTRELSEALTYQTGSSNILGVIASSPTDVAPVLEAIVKCACELCEAYDATVALKDGDDLRFSAHHGPILIGLDKWPINRNWTAGRAFLDQKPVHVRDLQSDEDFTEGRELARRMGHRSILSVPLLREGESIGAIVLRRTEVQPFSDKQIALLQTFADQAVIAIGNVRLFEEVQAKTRDLTEALTYQTGSGNILRVIASSPTNVGPVLNAIVESASELCEAYDAVVLLKDGDDLRFSAHHGPIPINIEKWPISRGWTAGRAFLDQKPVHVRDLLSDQGADFPDGRELSRIAGLPDSVRTILSVPLLREKESIGAILLRRTEVQPFSEKQIALLQTFADQAVIAIGNVRLFDEVQAKTRDLTESLQQQTATADVLKVISRSTFDLPAVLQTLVESAARLCDADKTNITREKKGGFYRAEAYGFSPEFQEYVKDIPIEPGRGSAFGRALLEGRVVHIPDVLADSEYAYLEGQRLGDYRTVLTVPMLREGVSIGVLSLARTNVRPFTDKQIELATTFADQAAIAIENVRLFDSVEARTRELAKSLEELRTAQDRLVQTQKLASLGQLTAGIAHEIKNPLNFVNNFSALSAELTDELNDVLKPAALNDKLRQEVDELTRLLKDNLEKVVQHGKRADSIVKNMLLHSREGSGEHRPTEINALLDESLNLAYHGARAEKREFNVTLQRDFDETAGAVDLFPQEITRAFLNLISNGFYAANKRKREVGSGFEPVLHAATRDLGDSVEIRIRDNGTGIPAEVKEKMFNPFFTTKPAGEGTGLGLSMSHDIIVKQHGGTIDVDTEPGEYTEFRIVLPRTSNIANKTRGPT
jgi:GAF domain-containing protein